MIIVNNVVGCNLKPLNYFEDFQGKLKVLDKKNLVKLKNNILSNGWIAPVFVWKNKILDGHGRLTALKVLFEEGHTLSSDKGLGGEIPFIEITAKNEKTAKKYVLAYNSQYGKITNQGLTDFVVECELNLEELNLETTFNYETETTKKTEIDEGKDVDKIGSLLITCPFCKKKFKKGKNIE